MSGSINLYRYFSAAAAINTIERRQFRLGRIVEFNDPFEWSYGFNTSCPKEIAEERVKMEELRAHFNEIFGVVCFCKVVEDPVIWSHYADQHRGIVIDVLCPGNDMEIELLTVSYQKEKVRIPIIPKQERESRMEELRPFFAKFFRCKGWNWRYENEVRGIVELGKCGVSDGKYWWPIRPGFIKSVIIGSRCTVSDLYMRRCLDTNEFGNVEVWRARESVKSYNVERIKCKTPYLERV